ncbi:MAG: YicC family protein, partial [Desulfuromonadales bacterium]
DLAERLNAIEGLLEQIEQRAPQVPLEWQGKLTERLAKLQQNVELDPQRVAQEIAIFADRCDISEEISRFRSHMVQFRALFDDEEPVGRRMDFLVQELNREVNTMGSKSNDADLTNTVVSLKSELEKVREQVQNVE